jgi:hypothetical protein
MPITPAHPAAALPLRRLLGRFGSASALVIGSMAPDLEYFLPFRVPRSTSHSLAGLLWFCLPAGLALWATHRVLLRQFIAAMLPQAISRRLRITERVGWSFAECVAAAVSVLAGAVTHLAWDSFTHASGFAVRALPVLQVRVPVAGFYQPHLFKVLQHASSVVGLTVLVVMGVRWYLHAPIGPVDDSKALPFRLKLLMLVTLLLPSAAVALGVVALRVGVADGTSRVLRHSVGHAVFSAGTVLLMSFILAALVWRLGDAVGSRGEDERR